jgi:hypothetical protein
MPPPLFFATNESAGSIYLLVIPIFWALVDIDDGTVHLFDVDDSLVASIDDKDLDRSPHLCTYTRKYAQLSLIFTFIFIFLFLVSQEYPT